MRMLGSRSLQGTLLFIFFLALVTSSLFDACYARTRKHWVKLGRRPSQPPIPSFPLTPSTDPSELPPQMTFSVLDFGAAGDGFTDDTKVSDMYVFQVQAFQDAWAAACNGEVSEVVVPADFQFLVGPVSFSGHSCQPNIVFQVCPAAEDVLFLQLDGTIVASTSSDAWSSGDVPQLLEFKYARGLTIQGSGTIDGQGSRWWGGNSEHDSSPTVTGAFLSPPYCFDACRAVEVHGITISSPGNSPNTDGIHLHNSIGVSIHHSTIACGDDCISIQDGCSNVFIHNVNCGPGHGISIGGLGKDDTQAIVSDISVQDVSMTQTMTGVRIKTWQGGSGSVKNIRFANIQVSEVKTPIVIDQFYCDHTKCTNQTTSVALSDIIFQGFAGTYTMRPVYLACSDSTPCSNLYMANIELTPIKENYHLYGPFCWNAYVDLRPPTEPPIDCLMTRRS